MLSSRTKPKRSPGRVRVIDPKPQNDGIDILMPVEHKEPPVISPPPDNTRSDRPSSISRYLSSGWGTEITNLEPPREPRASRSRENTRASLLEVERYWQERLEEVMLEKEGLKRENERLQNEIKRKRETSQGRVMKEEKKLRDRIKELEEERDRLKKQVETLEAEKEGLKRKRDLAVKSRKSNKTSEAELERLRQRVTELEAVALTEADLTNKRRNELEGRCEKLETEVETLKEGIRREKLATMEARDEVEDLKWKLSEKEKQNMELNDRIKTQEIKNAGHVTQTEDMERIREELVNKEKLLEKLQRVKEDLESKVKESQARLEDTWGLMSRLQADNDDLSRVKSALQSELKELQRDMERIKEESCEKGILLEKERQQRDEKEMKIRVEHDKALAEERMVREKLEKSLSEKSSNNKDSIPAVGNEGLKYMRELVKEQESHISDLQKEVESLRLTVTDYQQEVDRLRSMCGMSTDRQDASSNNSDLAAAHRRLLEENSKVLALLERYRPKDAATLRRPTGYNQSDPGGLADSADVLRKSAGDKNMRARLDLAQSQLRVSGERVKQLENWLDEIYNNEFDLVPRRSSSEWQGRGSNPHVGGGRHTRFRSKQRPTTDNNHPTSSSMSLVNYKTIQDNRRAPMNRKRLNKNEFLQ